MSISSWGKVRNTLTKNGANLRGQVNNGEGGVRPLLGKIHKLSGSATWNQDGIAGDLGLSGRQRISVIFKIDKTGSVTGVRARAPHPRLEKEAQRVINLLPKMKPGKQRGKAVIVPYSLPIIFQVQD